MAQQTTIRLVDDIDGTEADETVEFSLGRTSYLIDLSEDNAAKLRDALAEFTGAARRTGGSTTRRRHNSSRRSGKRQLVEPAPQRAASNGAAPTTKTIRQWAQANGHDIGDRGRIPQSILDAHAASLR